ncbi:MAG: hypothetical protein ACTSRI_08430 [Promethearchaeota archaeon]
MIANQEIDVNMSENFLDLYNNFKEALNKFPFVIIIGKYDHILGPKALYSSVKFKDEEFVKNLLRDALNTKNKFVILDFNRFYSQIYKIEVEDLNARGRKQLYAIILLRDIESPLIPRAQFKRISAMFRKIGNEKILLDDEQNFDTFFHEISKIYIDKEEILPLESVNLQIRSGINTIQGFCELILEDKKSHRKLTEQNTITFIEMMLDACNEIIESITNMNSF